MLIVVEHGYVAQFLESALYLETARRGNVLQVDAAVTRRDVLDGGDDLFGILRGKAHGYGVHSGEFAEEHALPFHDRHAGKRTYIAQSEHSAAVRDDGDGVPFAGEVVDFAPVFGYLQARRGDAGGVRERKRFARIRLYARGNFELAFPFIVLFCTRG